MGFIVLDPLTFADYRLPPQTNCYVTVRHSFWVQKVGTPELVRLTPTQRVTNLGFIIGFHYYVYPVRDFDYKPLETKSVLFSVVERPADLIGCIYQYLKNQVYAGKRTEDVLEDS